MSFTQLHTQLKTTLLITLSIFCVVLYAFPSQVNAQVTPAPKVGVGIPGVPPVTPPKTGVKIPKASGGLTNPVIGNLGNSPTQAAAGVTFLTYFVFLWRAIISIGGLFVLLYFIWGAIEWINAGGDSGKITKARDRITQSMVGLIILVFSFVIIGFLGELFFGDNFNILLLSFPTPL